MYYNKRSPIQLQSDHWMLYSEEEKLYAYHELACYNLRQLSYAPILQMKRDPCMIAHAKYNENHLRFTDSCDYGESFEIQRPLLVVDRLRLAHVNNSFETPKIKVRIQLTLEIFT